MSVHRTPWWQYLLGLILGLIAGMLLANISETSGLSLIGVPWFVSVVLLLLGIMVLVMALQVHQYATTDPAKRARLKPLDPTRAVYTLMLAKALGLAGAVLAGWYVGQIVVVVGHIEAEYYADAVVQCVFAAIVCVIDVIIGIVGEWLCQLPPSEGPENPKMKEARRRASMAPAAAKTQNLSVSFRRYYASGFGVPSVYWRA